MSTAIRFDNHEIPSDFPYEEFLTFTENKIIYPDSIIRSGNHTISRKEYEGLIAGEWFMTFFGKAIYRDVFDDELTHESTFSFHVTPAPFGPLGEDHAKLQFVVSGPHNYAT